jgi:hypothetical protein
LKVPEDKKTNIHVFLSLLSFYLLTRSFPHPGEPDAEDPAPRPGEIAGKGEEERGKYKNIKECKDDISLHT